MTSQVIEGIYFIKLYGWEIAFKDIIQKIREKEIAKYLKIAFGRGLVRGLPFSVFPISCFVSFVVVHFTTQGNPLTVPIIFTSLEIMYSLRYYMLIFGMAVGFYFDALVVLERFCSIINIKEMKMVQIDSTTKQPIQH